MTRITKTIVSGIIMAIVVVPAVYFLGIDFTWKINVLIFVIIFANSLSDGIVGRGGA